MAILGVDPMAPSTSKAGWGWVAGITIVLAYAAWALMNNVPHDTLSEWVWAHPHPMLSFAAGVVIGHLFWQRQP